MSDALQLKKHVKQLQNASTNEVCPSDPSVACPTHSSQERVAILKLLKKDFQVNESLLRVGISRVSSEYRPTRPRRRARPGLPWASSVHTTQRRSPTSPKRLSKSGKTTSTRQSQPPSQPPMQNNQVRPSPRPSCSPAHTRLVRKQSTSVTPAATPASNGKADVRSSKTDGVKVTATDDNTRNRCAELIYDGLAHDSGARESIFPRVPSNLTRTASQPAISSPTARSPSKPPCLPTLAARPQNTRARSVPCS